MGLHLSDGTVYMPHHRGEIYLGLASAYAIGRRPTDVNRLLDFPKPVFSMLWQFMQRFNYELAVLSRFFIAIVGGYFFTTLRPLLCSVFLVSLARRKTPCQKNVYGV